MSAKDKCTCPVNAGAGTTISEALMLPGVVEVSLAAQRIAMPALQGLAFAPVISMLPGPAQHGMAAMAVSFWTAQEDWQIAAAASLIHTPTSSRVNAATTEKWRRSDCMAYITHNAFDYLIYAPIDEVLSTVFRCHPVR